MTGQDITLEDLRSLIIRLRSPQGCPWDRRQTPQDLGKYLLEEAYEVIDALRSNSPEALREELGDTLFQILFLAHLAEESHDFTLSDVLRDIHDKMVRRHPHVFGTAQIDSAEAVKEAWHAIKRRLECKDRGGLLAGVPLSMPALMQAQKVTERAARAGFDWLSCEGVLDKMEEEWREFRVALAQKNSREVSAEIGDLFLTLVNLSRFFSVDAEQALQGSVEKFRRRFAFVEKRLADSGKKPEDSTLEEMDGLWNESKRTEGENDRL